MLFACSKDKEIESLHTSIVLTNDFSIIIDENPTDDYLLGQIEGYSVEGIIRFTLTNQNPYNAFFLDRMSGKLTVRDSSVYNFEKYPVIKAVANVSNGFVTTSANITVHLKDIYEI